MMNRQQSGFRSNHSTTTALLKITNDLLMASEEKLVSLLVLLDCVDHLLLCSKLSRQYNFYTSAVTPIMSYLSGGRQCVYIGDQASEISTVTSGVLQVSVLGPLLLSLLINDITNVIESSHYHTLKIKLY
jgi:hypothetical protein